jgi:uncharacterized membrane protein (UPF0136 family)
MEKANLDKAEEDPAGGSTHRRLLRRVWMLVQAAGLAAAVAMGVHGSLLLDELGMPHFYEALRWYGLALLALVVFAWDPALPRAEEGWRKAISRFLSKHRLEILLFAAIFAFGIFMRLYKYGVLPPHDTLVFEEGINGGVAYTALQGAPQLAFPLARYASAAGFLVFGENTLGLRFFFILSGIVMIPVFYLLLRELVSVPIALFGTLLLAAAYWPSFFDRQAFHVSTMLTILLAYFLVRGIRTRSPLMFVFVGILCSLLSYEYENFKPVPLYTVGFLGALALWQIGQGARGGLRSAWIAVLAIFKKAWRPALAFAVAAGIVAAPLIMGTHLGQDLYLSSLHRQEADRTNRGTPGLIAPNWEQQAKWSVQLFLPFGPRPARGQPPATVPGVPVIDPISATLLVAGAAYAAVTLFRPYRLYFLGWFLATLAGGALLLSNWEPWKFEGLVPVGLVLAAFLIDDVRSLWARFVSIRRFLPIFSVALLGVAVYVCWWNPHTLFDNMANNPSVIRGYALPQSQWYQLCRYLRGLGNDNFTYTPQGSDTNLGFARPHKSFREQQGSWGDYIWVCHDLEGATLPGTQETWPLRDVHSDPLSLAFVIAPDALEPLEESVEQGYPGLIPDRVIEGPLSQYYVVGYALSNEVVRSRQGLYGEYTLPGQTEPVAERVDKVHNLSWADVEPPVQAPFTVRWTGLVYLSESGPWLLQAVSDDAAWISVDGGAAYNANDVSSQLPLTEPLVAGWHTVEITLAKERQDGSVLLRWVSPTGASSLLQEQDLFALHPVTGWLHTRRFLLSSSSAPASSREVVQQRIDHSVEFAYKRILLDDVNNLYRTNVQSSGEKTDLIEETFSSWWAVKESKKLMLTLKFSGGEVATYVDGTELRRCRVGHNQYGECALDVDIAPGKHRVEIRLKGDGDSWGGARLIVSGPAGPLPEGAIEITPF